MSIKKGLHKEDIKAEVRKRKTTLRRLSLDAGFHPSTCGISLQKPIPRANKVIADFLKVPLSHLWPAWYDSEGQKILKRSSRKSSRKKGCRHCKKSTGGFA